MEIGKLGFGVYKITDEEKMYKALETAIKSGYKLIDTATYYKNEYLIGKFLKEKNISNEVIVTTKVWPDDMTYDGVLKSFDKSYKDLDGKLDILLLHWPKPNTFIESYKALERLYNEKVIKKIGVSNFEIDNLEELKSKCNIKPYFNQIELHPKLSQKELREYHKKEGIITEAWSPIGKARYLDNEVLKNIALKYKATIVQIILAWHRYNGIYAIPKSETPSRIIENMNSININLEIEDILKIDTLNCNYRIGAHPKTFPY